jgi:hypothetical protein
MRQVPTYLPTYQPGENWEAGFLGHITATRSRSAGRSVGRSVNAARSRRIAVASCSLRAACFFWAREVLPQLSLARY